MVLNRMSPSMLYFFSVYALIPYIRLLWSLPGVITNMMRNHLTEKRLKEKRINYPCAYFPLQCIEC